MDPRLEPDEPVVAAPVTVPFWLQRLGALGWRILAILAFVAAVAWLAWAISTVTASIALAFLVSATMVPVVHDLRRRGWGASRAAAAATVTAAGVVVLVLAVAAWVLIRYGPELVTEIRRGLDYLHSGELASLIPPEIAGAITEAVDSLRDWIAANVGSVVSQVANLATVLLFGAFTTFYVLQDAGRGWRWLTQGLDDAHRDAAARSALQATGSLGGYVRTVAVLAAIEALADLVFLVVLGVPLAVPLATLAFAAGFVPYLGGIVATIAILLAAVASIGSVGTLVLLALIVIANLLMEWLVAPRFRSSGQRTSPAVVLIALPIGAYVAGLFGVVLAVPLAVAGLAIGGSIVDVIRPTEAAEPDVPPLVPPWLDLLAQWSWRLLVGIALVAVAAFAIGSIPLLALPLLLAAVLGATLAPLVGGLEGRGWGRSAASAAVIIGTTAIIVVVSGLSIAALVGNASGVAGGIGDGAGSADDWLGGLGGLLTGLVGEVGGGIVTTAVAVTAAMAGVALVVTVGLILTYFALRDGGRAWGSLTARMAPWRRRELDGAADRAVSVLGGYMLGTGVVSLFGAATQWLLMVVLGVPLALPVFVLSFFLGYIPYIGSAIGTGIAFLLTISTGNVFAIVVMLVFTVVFNIVQGNVVQPLVFSRAVNIHPAIVLLAIPAGGALGGILGMFLVVPFLGVVAATWRTVLVVLGGPPVGDADIEPPVGQPVP